MHGQALLARPRRAVPYGNRELDAPRIARAGRRDQTQRQARRPRANGLEQLGEEGAAKHRDLGIRVALQRVDRERQAQGFAVPEKRAFGLGQAQLGMIRAECGLLHTSELAVALEQRPDARVGERIAVADRLLRRQSRLAPRLGLRLGLGALGHSASASMSARNRGRRSTCATNAIARPELLTPLSLTSSPYLGWLPAGWCVVTPPMRSIDLSASSTSVTWPPSRPSNVCAPPNSPRIRSSSPTTSSNSLILRSSSWRMYASIVPAAARFTMCTSRVCPIRCSRPMRCSTTIGFQGRS